MKGLYPKINSGGRICVVCGARVENMNPQCVTCDMVCTAAKKAVRTRIEQLTYEMEHPTDHDMMVAAAMRDRYEMGDEP